MVLAAAALTLVGAPPASANRFYDACTTDGRFTVPANVHTADVTARGNRGADGQDFDSVGNTGGTGGAGAAFTLYDVKVTPGQTIYWGSLRSGGFEGGGDAKWVSFSEPDENCDPVGGDVIAVAAGGGSGSSATILYDGSDGGAAGRPGEAGHGTGGFPGGGGGGATIDTPGVGGSGGDTAYLGGFLDAVPTFGSEASGGTGHMFWDGLGADPHGFGGAGARASGDVYASGGQGGAGSAGGGGGGAGGGEFIYTSLGAAGGGGGGGGSWPIADPGLSPYKVGDALVSWLPDATMTVSASTTAIDVPTTLTATLSKNSYRDVDTGYTRKPDQIGGGSISFTEFTGQTQRPLGTVTLTGAETSETVSIEVPEGFARGSHEIRALYTGFNGYNRDPVVYARTPITRSTFTLTAQTGQTIAFPELTGLDTDGRDLVLQATASSGLPVTYVSTTPDVCTVTAGRAVGRVGGLCSITASQAGGTGWTAAPDVVRTRTLSPRSQSVAFALAGYAYSTGSYSVTATSTSGLPVDFTTTTPEVCRLDGTPFLFEGLSRSVFAGVAAGTCVVRAGQPGDQRYASAPAVETSFTVVAKPAEEVVRKAQSIDFRLPTSALTTDEDADLRASAGSGLPVTVTSTTPEVCSIIGGTSVRNLRPGTCTIRFDQEGSELYLPAPQRTGSFTVDRLPQSIVYDYPHGIDTARSATYSPVATATSGLPTTYGATGGCTIADGVVTFTEVGEECVVTADQLGNADYAPALQRSSTFTVRKGPQTITLASTPPTTGAVGDTVTLTMTTSSGLPAFAVAYDACRTTRVDPGSVDILLTAVGTCSYYAFQQGDSTYQQAPNVAGTVQVTLPAQTIAFTSTPPSPAVPGGTYTPAATGGASGQPVVLAASGACTLTDGVVTFEGSGTCTVTADQAGDSGHLAAPQVSQTIAVGLAAGSVSFGGEAPGDAVVGGSSTPVIVRGPSSADPRLTASGACSVSGGSVSYDHAGSCTLTLEQAGDAAHAAARADRAFTIGRAAQTVAFTSTAPAAVVGGTWTPTVTGGASSAPTVLRTASAACTVANGTVTFAAPGDCVLTLDQAGDADRNAAPQATRTLVVTAASIQKKPQTVAFTANTSATPTTGVAYSLAAKASSGLPVAYTATGPCTVTAAGTVTLTGTSACTVTAAQAGDGTWAAATATRIVKIVSGSRADLKVALTPTATKITGRTLTATTTVTNVGTRDSGSTVIQMIVPTTVTDIGGATRTPGKIAGTTVLTWKIPTLAAGQSTTRTIVLIPKTGTSTITAKSSTAIGDPTPGDNTLTRSYKK
ncbi:DUF11 domain-containing protein [Rathayibacter sp. AY1B1]|uniref:DUF11 domain-containing protein n=1 Tax=Rathayibacter sp. AY1B1 TaxID=2080528 RepID=UPI0015E3A7F3|nr:DUF11 domain-containing protein [Rathayibacter sp. AY1B1]